MHISCFVENEYTSIYINKSKDLNWFIFPLYEENSLGWQMTHDFLKIDSYLPCPTDSEEGWITFHC